MPAKKKEPTEPTRRSTRVVSSSSTTTKESPPTTLKRAIEKPTIDVQEEKETPAKKAKKGLGMGDKLPDITLQDEEGNDIKVVDIASEKGIILFAYPKASTPGCTKQVRILKSHSLI
jgi:peroxiredoxin Q/BCP